MKSICYKELRDFLNSNVNESIYFGTNIDNLITLKEYLNHLKKQFDMCEKRIINDREFILNKYKKVDSIVYSKDTKSLVIKIKNSNIPLIKDIDTAFYIPENIIDLKFNYFLIAKTIGRKYVDELNNIKNESQKYFAKNNRIESVSGVFSLEDYYNCSTLFCSGYEFFNIDKKTVVPSKHTYNSFANYYEENEELSVKDKQRLLTKIMIPR